ncbi:cytochrome c maturation protein CcmE [Methanosarcina sp. KYL-1]|uniref:cytochrome c maturation protein CcmE domain-containing protein n=1 Tax=Methanosarcina sp. KYL-1 TaxID=2602068 RepID=UPI002101BC33|nr:cytochrome c maturation protein CcmE [Methanosarcina sp. KYL-1]MCQ1534350.1 cytochrome c maturation protein CcmE [Methanosarcina sp. KYL-1]
MNKKKKTLLAIAFIAGVTLIALYGVDSGGYLSVSELLTDPQAHVGQKVNAVGIVEYGSIELSPGATSFELRDENDESLKVRVEYVGDLPSNLAEGKQVSISGAMVSEDTFEANKIVTGCPSKYTE